MLITPTKNLVWKNPFTQHLHSGVSKLGKICILAYCTFNTFLAFQYPKAVPLFSLLGGIGTFLPQCVDIIFPDPLDSRIDNDTLIQAPQNN